MGELAVSLAGVWIGQLAQIPAGVRYRVLQLAKDYSGDSLNLRFVAVVFTCGVVPSEDVWGTRSIPSDRSD